MKNKAELILKLNARFSPQQSIKDTPDGKYTYIPIIGDKFTGLISGDVLCGGAYWSKAEQGVVSHVFSRYILLSEDSEYITIVNEGYFNSNNTKRLIVTESRIFVSSESQYGWLNHGQYLCNFYSEYFIGEVNIDIYKTV